MEFLIKTVVMTEVPDIISGRPPLIALDFLRTSISKIVFEWYTKFEAASWLSKTWEKYLLNIEQNFFIYDVDQPEAAGESADENKDKLVRLCFGLIESILQALPKAPIALWDFSCILADYTSQDPLQFIFINFFALALKNPVEYGLLTRKPGRKELRILEQLSIMFMNIANNADYLLPKLRLDPADRQKFSDRIKTWLDDYVLDEQSNSAVIPWSSEREALMNLTDYILENQEFIDSELKFHSAVHHTVQFGLAELIDSLNPPPLPQDNPRLYLTKTDSTTSSPLGDKRKIFPRKKRN
jgi:hypothetical protein